MTAPAKKSNGGKIAIAILAIFALIVASGYAIMLRPFLSPKPLADVVPDDTAIVVSIDLMNVGNTAYKYIRTIGLGRFQDLMATDEEEEEDSGMPGKMVGLARPWITREIMVLGDASDPDEPDFAVLVGSHSKGAAEKNFPKMLDLIKDEKARSAEETSKDEAKKIRAMKIKFDKIAFEKTSIYCNKDPKSVVGNFCWASTSRALVISPNQEMVKAAVKSINGKRTKRQKMLAGMRSKNVPDNYLIYAYADREKMVALAGDALKGQDMLDKELKAVHGALYSISYKDLSPDVRLGLVLDEEKIKDTSILRKLVTYKPTLHNLNNRIDKKNALAYVSLNNVDNMAETLLKHMPAEDRKDLEKELKIDLDKVVGALGGEAALAIMDFSVSDDSTMQLKAIAALQVKDQNVIVDAARNVLKAVDDRFDIKKTADDSWEVLLPPQFALPDGMKPVLGYKNNFLYASLDSKTLDRHMNNALGEAAIETNNVQILVNGPRSFSKILRHLPQFKTVNYLTSFADAYGPTEMTFSATPGLVEARLLQTVYSKGIYELPLEEIMNKNKENDKKAAQAAKAKKQSLPALAGVIPENPAVLLGANTHNTMAVYRSLLTALLSRERIQAAFAFVQEIKTLSASAPAAGDSMDEEAGSETAEGFDPAEASDDWEADTLDEVQDMDQDWQDSENSMDEMHAKTMGPNAGDLIKLAVIGFKSISMTYAWYGGEAALAVGSMPSENEKEPQAAVFVSARDKDLALQNTVKIFTMFLKANFAGLYIADKGKGAVNGVTYHTFYFNDSKDSPKEQGATILVASVKGALIVTTSKAYLENIAATAAGSNPSFQDTLGSEIPDGYTGYAYANGEFLSAMVSSTIDSMESQKAAFDDYSSDDYMMENDWNEDAGYESESTDEFADPSEESYEESEPGMDETAMETEDGAAMESEGSMDESMEAVPDNGPGMTHDDGKLKMYKTAAEELKAVRGILVTESFKGISPSLSLDIFLDKDKVAQTEYIQKLYQYQSASHEIDKLVRADNAILYLTLNNLNKILSNVNENYVAVAKDEKTVKLRNDFAEMGTSLDGIANALGNEMGVALLDIIFDRETYGYIPKFIAAIDVQDFGYLQNVLEQAVALRNQNKANELYEGDLQALLDSGEQMEVEQRGDNLLAVRLPTLIQYGEDLRLLIGFDGSHAFLSLHQDVLDEYMAGGKGSDSDKSTTFQVSLNPSQARRFAEDILYVGANDETKPKPVRDRERAKGDFMLGLMGIIGKGEISVVALPDRVSIDITQNLNRQAIVDLPDGKGFEWARGLIIEKNFKHCSDALNLVREGTEFYSFDQESMSFAGIGTHGDNLAHYMPMFPDCTPGQCKSRVKAMVEKSCDAGTFNIDVSDAGDQFVIHGKAKGSDCNICITPYFQNFNLYGECLADPGMTCEM